MTSSGLISENKLALWRECFGDGEVSVRGFYELPHVKCYSYMSGDGLVGMAHVLPVRAGEARGGYVYAVGVAESHRGRGIFRRLMRAVERESYDFLCLVPGNERLAETYFRYGYDIEVPRCGREHEEDSTPILPSEAFSAWAEGENENFGLAVGLAKKMSPKCPEKLHFAKPMGEG